ncbi:bifunctional DNA primase/polymerase [Pseudonocardia hydrocarbonoxydans]|uniref:bifunctional DNA primase/polymerase n=1 Tax=Pseudonocardia hydrocarbonoxydans TaxID=76726 RepID=UPI0031DAE692
MTHTHPTGDHGGPPPPLLAAALRAVASGWAVFPVVPDEKTPAIREWERRATTDKWQIHAWWGKGSGRNVGLVTGRSGLLVVDLDAPDPAHRISSDLSTADDRRGVDGAPGEALGGVEVLRRLAIDAGEVPPWDTFTVATPSAGGLHLYFRQPDGPGLRNSQGALGPRIDTRGHGGYVLAAGSRGPGGTRYRILRDTSVAPLPAWLHDALIAAPAPPPDPGDAARPGRDHLACHDISTDAEVPVASAARVAAYLRAVVDGESRAVIAAPVGTRHTTLLRAARRLGQWVGGGALTSADARMILTAAARGYVGFAGYTARQVERDITDGLVYGAARPRHLDDIPDRSGGRAIVTDR